MPIKTKVGQKKLPNEFQGKDGFQTPRYSTELILPYIPKEVKTIWEIAAGERRISKVLDDNGYKTHSTDIRILVDGVQYHNFINGEFREDTEDCLITNPPFTIKGEFFKRCLEYKRPFALLVPYDVSGWFIDAIDKYGCERITPTRRIDYLTPNILFNIAKKELWKQRPDLFTHVSKPNAVHENEWNFLIDMFGKEYLYDSIDDVPNEVLKKNSSSDFHSTWLTWGFGLGTSEVFVELSLTDKLNIK